MTIKVKIIDPNTIEYPSGNVVETHSTPNTPPPKKDMCWHDALCKWVPSEMMNKSFEYEMDVPGADDTNAALSEYLN